MKQLQNTLSPYEMLQGYLLNSHLPNPVPNPTPPHPTSPQEKRSKVLTQSPQEKRSKVLTQSPQEKRSKVLAQPPPPPIRKKTEEDPLRKCHPLWEGDINRIAPISYQSQRTLGTRLEWPSTGALKERSVTPITQLDSIVK